MLKPPVSVVIPTYNCAGVIRKALNGIVAQEWPAVEVVVVDDASGDKLSEVLAEEPRLAFTFLRNRENRGPAFSRNRGIEVARHEWIAFLDADDEWLPGKLELQFAAMARTPKADFCHTMGTSDSGQAANIPFDSGTPLFPELLKGNILVTTSVVARKCLLQELGGFQEDLRTGEDWDLWLRMSAQCASVYVPNSLVLKHQCNCDGKYPLPLLENCKMRVLRRLFENDEVLRRWPEIRDQKNAIYAWHYSVLARSYLKHGDLFEAARLATLSLKSSKNPLRFLVRHGSGKNGSLSWLNF